MRNSSQVASKPLGSLYDVLKITSDHGRRNTEVESRQSFKMDQQISHEDKSSALTTIMEEDRQQSGRMKSSALDTQNDS